MDKKEKNKKVYQKNNIIVNDETVEVTMQDKERTKGLIRIYKQEEMESMNYILEKSKDNKIFTKFELEFLNKIDLFDKKVVDICKIIWDNRDSTEKLEKFMKIINKEVNV